LFTAADTGFTRRGEVRLATEEEELLYCTLK
jgi:hypothetical protein